MVGTLLGDGWCNVGLWLAHYWVMVGIIFGYGRYNFGLWLDTDMTELVETWRRALEDRGMGISRPNTQFIDFQFGQ